jgi:hypothetical protein
MPAAAEFATIAIVLVFVGFFYRSQILKAIFSGLALFKKPLRLFRGLLCCFRERKRAQPGEFQLHDDRGRKLQWATLDGTGLVRYRRRQSNGNTDLEAQNKEKLSSPKSESE